MLWYKFLLDIDALTRLISPQSNMIFRIKKAITVPYAAPILYVAVICTVEI
jgi:hypothetical protein